MSIYHLSAKTVSRSAGRSATAAAAYRAGCEIEDTRTGQVFDYTKKQGVLFSCLILPAGGTADRAEFWNKVENHHKRGDAVTAREIEVSLPSELTLEQRQELAVNYATELANKYGVAADVCLHEPKKLSPKEAESSYHEIDSDGKIHNGNWHAHILLSACYVSPDGALGKKAVELDPIHCQRAKIDNSVEVQRVRWQELANSALQKAGREERIDCRTLEAQGIEREPQIHHGNKPARIERNNEIVERNALVIDLRDSLKSVETELAQIMRDENNAIKANLSVIATPAPTPAPISYTTAKKLHDDAKDRLDALLYTRPLPVTGSTGSLKEHQDFLRKKSVSEANTVLKTEKTSKAMADKILENLRSKMNVLQRLVLDRFDVVLSFNDDFGKSVIEAQQRIIDTAQRVDSAAKLVQQAKDKDYKPEAEQRISAIEAHQKSCNDHEAKISALELEVQRLDVQVQEALVREPQYRTEHNQSHDQNDHYSMSM
jgi:hypothetical protein